MAACWVSLSETGNSESNAIRIDQLLVTNRDEELDVESVTESDQANSETRNTPTAETQGPIDQAVQPEESTNEPEDSQRNVEIAMSISDALATRKSDRVRKEKRSYSPPPKDNKRKGRKLQKPVPGSVSKNEPKPFDKGPDGQPFCCDLCQSPYIIDPTRRLNTQKPAGKPTARQRQDPATGKFLVLCNACGLAFDRPRRQTVPTKPKISQEEREKYLDEARTFALSLVEGLNDPEAERLACPRFTEKPCGCLQRYIIGDGQMEDSRRRASELLVLLKEAKRLSAKKYRPELLTHLPPKKKGLIGLGNGHKKSQEFEDFVLANRKTLRENLKLCERAVQRVLMYSNNFLHKRLKTEPERDRRLERQKGKAALGQLQPISELGRQKCCHDYCCRMALTHGRLLEEWRKRAMSGQTESRRVLAEMLTPSGGSRCNCYRFIMWVTGCSNSTIVRVNEQMRQNGGLRDPPEHGLKKYWREQAKKQKDQKVESNKGNTVIDKLPSSPLTAELLASQAVTAGSVEQAAVLASLGVDRQQLLGLIQRPVGAGQQKVTSLSDLSRNPHVLQSQQGGLSLMVQLPGVQGENMATLSQLASALSTDRGDQHLSKDNNSYLLHIPGGINMESLLYTKPRSDVPASEMSEQQLAVESLTLSQQGRILSNVQPVSGETGLKPGSNNSLLLQALRNEGAAELMTTDQDDSNDLSRTVSVDAAAASRISDNELRRRLQMVSAEPFNVNLVEQADGPDLTDQSRQFVLDAGLSSITGRQSEGLTLQPGSQLAQSVSAVSGDANLTFIQAASQQQGVNDVLEVLQTPMVLPPTTAPPPVSSSPIKYILSQLSDRNSIMAPNVNITFVQNSEANIGSKSDLAIPVSGDGMGQVLVSPSLQGPQLATGAESSTSLSQSYENHTNTNISQSTVPPSDSHGIDLDGADGSVPRSHMDPGEIINIEPQEECVSPDLQVTPEIMQMLTQQVLQSYKSTLTD